MQQLLGKGDMMRAISTAVLTAVAVGLPAGQAADPKTGFVDRVYTDPRGADFKYVLFVPHAYTGQAEFPLIVYLHGSRGRGDDGRKPSTYPLGQYVRKNEKDFPFFVLFPQARETWRADSEDGRRLIETLDAVLKDYKVDSRRVSLTGQSMGGTGTWSLAAKHPGRWAAIAPVCGLTDPATAPAIKDLPCWCFHGDADPTIGVGNSRRMIAALKEAGGSPKYDEYPGVGHNSYDRAYAMRELYDWLLRQTRK
jgi:predicted peptidase